MSDPQPVRIIVEVVSHADVKRLEDRDDEIRKEIARVERMLQGLHKTLYEALETIGGKRSNR